ncbi:helix-turn-helix domain-containing protein [Bacillus badius]|uniref:AlbA family DNA-binding domain-containing protein n=1 Tax=Bacillus badius TaxID=1455 RepID=UPI00059759D1|nr:ATP-binding protein [Bacillus badius]KIL74381.1 hypothetical protein SD78_1450 [Bacillus badius]
MFMYTKKLINKEEIISAYEKDDGFDRVKLKSIIENSYGESNSLDFKEKYIKESKIAKIIIAMANSGGGTVIFGINDEGKPVGIVQEEIKDITDLQKKIGTLLPNNLDYSSQIIKFEDEDIYGDLKGKTFFIFYIPSQNRYVPFLAKKESEGLKKNEVYIRKNASNEVATNEDLEKMFKLRLIEQYEDLSNLDLEDHLEQLKVLYNNINESEARSIFPRLSLTPLVETVKNKHYPKESYDEFVSNMIKKKKRKIEMVLEVNNIE